MSSILIDRFKEADNRNILNLIADIISACIIISLSGNSIRCPFSITPADIQPIEVSKEKKRIGF